MKLLFLLLNVFLFASCNSSNTENETMINLNELSPSLNENKIIGKWIITSMFYETKMKKNKGPAFNKKRLVKFAKIKNDSLIVSFNSNHEIIYNDAIIGKWKTNYENKIYLTSRTDSAAFIIPLDNEYQYFFPMKKGMKFRIPFFNDEGFLVIYLSYNLLKYEAFI